ncbi:hypothetical protein Val02_74590 [Virgisporangium aliadipatigenens]|uniref:Uncharacterized protein n=1 Tax=Virgisporangium aliadipatigenens TaxID=741659 RepID=A0A8J3YVP8_9ACTN|nr:hypothetical protein [Virgisporangium aliadipatigenens]GIJ50573.1 hypothetical protein Val02_74590 [Virgisporangium aliadipatigenens]
MLTVLAVAAMGAVGSLGSTAPALASTASFDVSVYHSTGVLSGRMTGDFRRLNQSVTITNIEQWVRAGECSYGSFEGWQYNPTGGSPHLDTRTSRKRCASANTWFEPEDFTLDAKGVTGGINTVQIYLIDGEHGRDGYGEGVR